MTKTIRAFLPITRILFAGALLGMMTACSSSTGQLRLESLDRQRNFSQTFNRAYFSQTESGDADVVLIADGTDVQSGDSKAPLVPSTQTPTRQLVHIRIFWSPVPGTHADHPANTNASIHWCFLGIDSRQTDILEYSGSGLVELNRSGNDASVSIRNAWMKTAAQHGNMTDPVGPSNLKGTVHATDDSAQVQAILAEIKSAGGNSAQASAASQPPAIQRLSVNP